MAIFGFSFEIPRTPGGPLSHSEAEGVAAIADSPDEVRLRAREQLRQGASQIKLMGGGGVSSPYNPIEIDPVHGSGNSRRRRGGRKLGHLCHRACLHAASHAAGHPRRRESHRAWASRRRGDGPDDGREGNLVEPAAADLRCGRVCAHGPIADRRRCRCSPEPTTPTRWRRNTRSRRPSARTSCSTRKPPAGREPTSPRWCAGTRPPKRSRWRRPTMAS